MRQPKEIATIMEDRGYSIHNIITDVLNKFNMKTLCHRSGLIKQAGYGTFEILVLLLILPLLALNTVNQLLKAEYSGLAKMKKDTIYRFKNNERYPWRSLLMNVAKMFRQKTGGTQTSDDIGKITAFIIDDTILKHAGWKIENITRVFDHCLSKSLYGFKYLVLGYHDGTSTIPVDFSLHSEKALEPAKKRKQHKKNVNPKSAGGRRRKELKTNKITQSVKMIKRAVKHGFTAKYVMCDSWFTSYDFIKAIRSIKNGAMHIIAGVRADKRKYNHDGELFSTKGLVEKCKAASKEKRCRALNIRYFELIVDYKDIGNIKLLICRYPGQKKWRAFISTDASLTFLEVMKAYGIRWTIEVMFKEMKVYLNLGKCQSNAFEAQIADATISSILYILLAYVKRVESYGTIGDLFQCINEEIREKTLAERLWALFEDLLAYALNVAAAGGYLDFNSFKISKEYTMIKEIFSSSFLSFQLEQLNKAS